MGAHSEIQRWIQGIVSFPCPICHNTTPDVPPNAFCPDCIRTFPILHPPYCPSCGGHLDTALNVCSSCLRQPKRPWKNAIALFHHEEPIQNIIHQFKYRKMTVYAQSFATYAKAQIEARANPMPEALIPVPMHWFRYLSRGYNQTELLAQALRDQLHIPIVNALKSQHILPHQMTLNRKERMKKRKDAFALTRHATQLKGKHVMLIDDVLTTGATLSAATECLKTCGVGSVTIFVIARR